MTDQQNPKDPAGEAESNPNAKQELFAAIDHFKRAANILFDRAANDPTIKSAATEAERVIQKLGATAEPLARQLTGELSRLTKRITDTLSETVEGRRKSETPPPPDDADGGGTKP